jgi:hypothetical protein
MVAMALTAALTASAGLLTGQGVAVLDQSGAQRQTFSVNETIGFQQIVNNGSASGNRIFFQFTVTAPNGNVVFRHVGNSVRGTVGNAASQVSGLAISGFAQGPGVYTLKAVANLDGVALEQDQTFTLSSPNVLLIYPPNGSQNLTDNPVTFQWYSSGASSYRVTVGDNAGLYNSIFTQNAPAGSSSLTYPQNPTDARQRLSTGQTYWWKVEGLDINGNVVAQSQVPFSFSVANTSLTRDLAIAGLEITGTPDSAGNIPFLVTIKNQGNTTESNTALRVTVGGLSAPGSPITVPQMSPADVKTFAVSAAIPSDQNQSLAIACLTIFDDNVANNCRTLAVNRPAATSTGTFTGTSPALSAEQIWDAIAQLLKEHGLNLDNYNLKEMEGSLTSAELQALLDQLRSGQAQATVSGPPLPTPAAAPAPAAPAESESGRPAAALAAEERGKTVAQEKVWSGIAPPLAAKTLSFAVTKADRWKKLWKRVSDEPVPEIDFTEHMVVGVIGGSGESADRVQIEDFRVSGDVMTVRYRLVSYARPFAGTEAKPETMKTVTPYWLVAIPRTALSVIFERIKEGVDDEKH